MVLLEAFSSPSRPVRHLFDLAKSWQERAQRDASAAPRYRIARQLRPAEIDQLVAVYQSGATVFELATRFNIHRTTVGRHLKDRGIDIRTDVEVFDKTNPDGVEKTHFSIDLDGNESFSD